MHKLFLIIFTSLFLLTTNHPTQAMSMDRLLNPETEPIPPFEWPIAIYISSDDSDNQDSDSDYEQTAKKSHIKKRKRTNDRKVLADAQLLAALAHGTFLPPKKRLKKIPKDAALIENSTTIYEENGTYYIKCPACPSIFSGINKSIIRSNLKHHSNKYHPDLTQTKLIH